MWVINRENIPWLVEYCRNAWPFDMVVIDESSSFKNHKAKRFKALTWVRKYILRIVELTGTPAPNGLLDLWAQIYLLDEGSGWGSASHNSGNGISTPINADGTWCIVTSPRTAPIMSSAN